MLPGSIKASLKILIWSQYHKYYYTGSVREAVEAVHTLLIPLSSSRTIMSKTAQGRIIGTSGTRFTATFVLPGSGMQVNYLGNFSSSIQPFRSANATLTYDNENQLTATRQFDGQLGINNVKLTLTNGPVISGPLDMPISPPSSVSGSGVWAIN